MDEYIKNPIIIEPPSNGKGEIKQCHTCKNVKDCGFYNTFGNCMDLHCYEE